MKRFFEETKKLLKCILSSMGAVGLILLILSFIPFLISAADFKLFLTVGFIDGIYAYIFFEKKIITHNLWVRRFLCLICDISTIIIYILGMRIIQPKSISIFIICAIAFGICTGVILFFLADHLEKKYLRQINEKLEKNK